MPAKHKRKPSRSHDLKEAYIPTASEIPPPPPAAPDDRHPTDVPPEINAIYNGLRKDRGSASRSTPDELPIVQLDKILGDLENLRSEFGAQRLGSRQAIERLITSHIALCRLIRQA